MKELERFVLWITSNINVVFGVIWLITIVFGLYSAHKDYFSNPQKGSVSAAIFAILGGAMAAGLLHVVLLFAFGIPYFLLAVISKHEEIFQLLRSFIQTVPSEKWREYYEYATYLATLAGLIQLVSYIFGGSKK